MDYSASHRVEFDELCQAGRPHHGYGLVHSPAADAHVALRAAREVRHLGLAQADVVGREDGQGAGAHNRGGARDAGARWHDAFDHGLRRSTVGSWTCTFLK